MIKTNIFVLVIRLQDVLPRCLQNVFKTSSRRLVTTSSRRLEEVFKTSGRRLQDVFKTSSRRLAKTFSRRLQNVFKTSCKIVFMTFLRRLQNVFKTSSRRLAKTFSRRLQNVFRTFQDVFETFLKRFYDVVQRRFSIEGFAQVTLLRNLWSVYKICQSDKSFSNSSFSLDYTFYWLLTEAYLEPGRTSQSRFFAKILSGFKL